MTNDNRGADLLARAAVREDVAELIELLPQISSRPGGFSSTPPLDGAVGIFEQIEESDHVDVLVVEDAESKQLLAVLTLAIVPNFTYEGRPWAIAENVVVRQGHRGRGIGKHLMAYACEVAEEAGCYKIQVLSGPKPDQIGFYRRAGFVDGTSFGFKRHFTDK